MISFEYKDSIEFCPDCRGIRRTDFSYCPWCCHKYTDIDRILTSRNAGVKELFYGKKRSKGPADGFDIEIRLWPIKPTALKTYNKYVHFIVLLSMIFIISIIILYSYHTSLQKDLNTPVTVSRSKHNDTKKELEALMLEKRYKEANKLCCDMLREDPDNPYYLYKRGEIFNSLEKYETALMNFKRAWKEDKEKKYQIEILINISNSYIGLQMYDEAIDSGYKVLRIDPGNEDILINLGIAYYRKNKDDNSLKFFNEVIKRNDKCIEAWIWKGKILEKSKRKKDALKCYERALQIDSKSMEANQQRKLLINGK